MLPSQEPSFLTRSEMAEGRTNSVNDKRKYRLRPDVSLFRELLVDRHPSSCPAEFAERGELVFEDHGLCNPSNYGKCHSPLPRLHPCDRRERGLLGRSGPTFWCAFLRSKHPKSWRNVSEWISYIDLCKKKQAAHVANILILVVSAIIFAAEVREQTEITFTVGFP